ncbi:MAG: TolC family protein [Bacteroidales bacterium]
MKKEVLSIIFFLFTVALPVYSQKSWTLEDCINYAVTNNIQVKRQQLQTEYRREDLRKSRMDLLPGINFESDGNLGFGRSVDPVTNLITFQKNISNSYTLSTSVNLFSGLSSVNLMEADRFMLKAGLEQEKIAVNSLVISILTAYYQVLYCKGLENSALAQQRQSEKQLFRIRKNVEAGKEAVARQYEIESRVSDDKLVSTIAINNTNQAITNLKQILQIEAGEAFDVTMPSFDSVPMPDEDFRTDSIFNVASEVLPRLKAITYELKASQKQLAAAKGGISPRLVAGGAIYTGYYDILGSGGTTSKSFQDQLKGNNSQAIYARLQIPIFNNYTNIRNIRYAKIRKNDTELRLELEKNNLYSDIENACLNYRRGKDEYKAALSSYEFNRKSYEVVTKRFETGLVDVTDYSAASTAFMKAETELTRTRLLVLIRKLVIKFYSTGDYKTIVNS